MDFRSRLDALERCLKLLLEQGPLRLFRTRLEPIHIVRALELQVGRHRLVGPRGIVVPHYAIVRLPPSDLDRLTLPGPRIPQHLAAELERFVKQRGWILLSPARVELVPDASLRPGEIQLEFRPDSPGSSEMIDPLPGTARMPLRAGESHSVIVQLPDGSSISSSKPTISIGRGAENDVVVPHPLVSRRHAELRSTNRAVELVDLDSTNGTWVNGARITRATMDGELEVRLGESGLMIRVTRG